MQLKYVPYGKLEVFIGPMYAGKTTSLLKTVLWNKHVGKTVYVYKPASDTRFGLDEVVSHDGLSVIAHNIRPSEYPEIDGSGNLVVFDEVQFFEADIIEWVWRLLRTNNDVVAVGLDMDSNGFPFGNSANLMAMADECYKLKSICSVCGNPATKTFKKIKNSERVQLGAADIYETRCNSHWVEV